jgi:tetratricopeptide (TPR) repeat protein
MNRFTLILFLSFLFVGVWPVQGQTPTTAADYVSRGYARQDKGDLEGAIADFTKAIEVDPRYANAYYNRGIARQAKGDHDGAIVDYTKAIEIDPRDAKAYYNRGIARLAKGDLDRAIGAIADFAKAIEIDPRHAKAYTALAWLLATASKQTVRDGQRAVEHARKAAELTNWQIPNVLGTLAAAYAETGNFDEAIKWQNKALSFPEYEKTAGEGARQRLQLYQAGKPYHEK